MLSVNSLNEIQQMILVIIGVLVFASTLFWIMRKIKPGPQVDELVLRTKSWWIMAGIFITAALVHPGISFVAFGFLDLGFLAELVLLLELLLLVVFIKLFGQLVFLLMLLIINV